MIGSRNSIHAADVVLSIEEDGVDRVAKTVATARDTQVAWSKDARARALRGAADELASVAETITALLVREVGMPIPEAAAEVGRTVEILHYCAAASPDKRGDVLPSLHGGNVPVAWRHPVGTVGPSRPGTS